MLVGACHVLNLIGICVRSQIGEDFALGGICLLVPMLARLVNYLICSTTSGAHEFQMSDDEILA